MTIITEFFHGNAALPSGENIHQVLRWMDYWFEKRHDFIQWIFPTKTASRYNPDAPLVTEEDIEAFCQNSDLYYQMVMNYVRFINFLQLSSNKKQFWIEKGNHNLLRITRCLESMTLLGCSGLAVDFLYQLENLTEKYPEELKEALPFWHQAIKSQ